MAESHNQMKLKACEEDVVGVCYPYERITVMYEKTGKGAKTPRRATLEAAGYDVFSAEAGEIPPGETRTFTIQTITKPAVGFHLKIYNRSGLACKEGVMIPGSPMTVDRDFRGEIRVTLWNTNRDKAYSVKKGQRIGQFMIERSYKIFWQPAKGLRDEETGRNPAGFGSTGR